MALANVTLTDTFDGWRTRTNQILVQGEQTFIVANGAFNKVNVVNVYATSIALSANSYATAVGLAGNSYATAVGTAGNSRAVAIGTSGNVYATAIGTSGNAYAIAVGAAGNVYALTTATAIGAAGNSYMIAVQNGSNTAVGTGANAYAAVVGTSANAYALATATAIGTAANTNAANGTYVSAGVVRMAFGGTSAALSPSAGAVAYSTSGAFAFTAVGTSGQLLQSGATGAPSWVSPSTLTVSRSSTTGTADNSNLLGGYSLQFGNVNGVAGRDGAGDITGRLFRAEYPDQSTISGAIAYRTNNTTDNYTRYCNTPSAVRGWLSAGNELLWALNIAGYTAITVSWGGGNLAAYKQLHVVGINASHSITASTRAFQINNQTCSDSFLGTDVWLGFVQIDLMSGVGFYVDQGSTITARNFGVFQGSTSFLLDLSSTGTMDAGAVYVYGIRGV